MNQPLKEKIHKIKQMLYLSGVKMFSYWLGMYIVDIIKFLIFLLIVFPFFLYIDHTFGYLFILFVPFIFVYILLCYIFTFLVNKEENGEKYLY